MLSSPLITLLAQTGTNPGALVQRDKLKEVSKSINEGVGHDMPWELLMVGLGATILAIAIISIRRRWLNRHKDPSPLMIYSAIARKAGLSLLDRLLLWRIARTFKLPTPITLLLARGTLRHYSELYLSNRAGTSRQRINHRIARIEAELFG